MLVRLAACLERGSIDSCSSEPKFRFSSETYLHQGTRCDTRAEAAQFEASVPVVPFQVAESVISTCKRGPDGDSFLVQIFSDDELWRPTDRRSDAAVRKGRRVLDCDASRLRLHVALLGWPCTNPPTISTRRRSELCPCDDAT